MLPSTSASLAAATAELSLDPVAASAPASTEVSLMESLAPPSGAASANTSSIADHSAVAPSAKPKKRRVSVAVARFAQPTIAGTSTTYLHNLLGWRHRYTPTRAR
jgi:hypothetical protein